MKKKKWLSIITQPLLNQTTSTYTLCKLRRLSKGMYYWFIFFVLSSCASDKKETDRYSFWKGDIENYYYILDMNNQPLQKVVGKPYMIMEYNPINGYPISVEFGLYDARNEYLEGVEGAIPEPFLSAGNFGYSSRLGLYGSVDLLCNWENVTSVSKLPSGDFEFYIDKGEDFSGHEIFHFTYTPDGMEGEIINSSAVWGGRVSDTKAFKLLRKFNSSTIE
ncbi:MAG TPA: hypothetical protein PLD12_02020 [Bacteroidales bacterium]|nr:hypothetical protein [Bacteroidales bacterium]HOK97891.1 hypothetical protein [Bacteroidales bacterium]HPO64656.1 hypothetical protein [Bacteroidales bacterium]